MKLDGRFDLTYCSNIHAGESWAQVLANLTSSLPRIREQLALDGPFGIGLRLSAAAAHDLERPEALAGFRTFLRDGDYYVPTINGFPFGKFHGTRVKEQVYLPDWRSDERVDYSNRLARLLAVLAADRGETDASISTVPAAFRGEVRSPGDVTAMAARMLNHAAYLKRLHAESGVRIALAIEPEPACYIETVDDAIGFFRDYLFDPQLTAAAGREAGISLSPDEVRRYIGTCLDTCHMAVEFEDPRLAFERLHDAGISVYKVQLSSALRLTGEAAAAPRALLGRFADDTYLHQVVTAGAAGLTRYVDLPEALDAAERDGTGAREEWRVHFHVPIFLDAMSGFDTTQGYLRSVLEDLDRTGACRCLEVETYTWDVLPAEYRTTDVCTAIARELRWVRGVLNA
jgi:sugar phosphate isomerase/epimerase